MRYIRGIIMSFSMFTTIPMPRVWDERAKNLIIAALPLVGLVIGAAGVGLNLLLAISGLGGFLQTTLLVLVPLSLTGFIHADGLMDTSDALFSRAERERKIAILKDSHVGSFAVISLAVFLVLQLAAVDSVRLFLQGPGWLALLIVPVLSRSLAGLFILKIPSVLTQGFAKAFRDQTGPAHAMFLGLAALVALAMAAFIAPSTVLPALLVELAAAGMAIVILFKQFRGISGDLGGFAICVSETAAWLALAIIVGVSGV
jgi:adenosylcobinamide-GDP ribazoletransferase